MHSYVSVYSGNQQLSWYGTTIQAAQPDNYEQIYCLSVEVLGKKLIKPYI